MAKVTYQEQKELLTQFCQYDEDVFASLYTHYYTSVEKYILKNKGTKEDAEDLFQETLLVFLEKLKQDDFQLTASIKTYLIAISKNIWLNVLRKKSKGISYSITEEDYAHVLTTEFDIEILKEKPLIDKLHDYFVHLTSHCQSLLSTIIENEKTTEEIQAEFGYTSKHNLNNQKYKCVKQLKKVKQLADAKHRNAYSTIDAHS